MKYVIITIGIVCLLSVSVTSHAISYNRGQTELLNLAFKFGKELPHPEILQVIMMNETVAGKWGRHGDKQFKNWRSQCYGVMQIQFRTAKMVVKNWTDHKFKNDQALKIRLQFDDAFNLKIARLYVKYLLKFNKGNYFRTILSYNTGPGNVQKHGLSFDPNRYVKRAKLQLKRMMRFNARQGNGTIVSHTIERGDTLSKLAKKYLHNWKRWREILHANSGLSPRKLKVGTKIYISI